MIRTVEEARDWFAEDLRVVAGIKSRNVVEAFARTPRERFVGPPPWRIRLSVTGFGLEPPAYQTVESDTRVLYHDVVVALDEEQEINNGQPSLWARMFDALAPRPSERILHLGCGTGYYSAVLAEIVGPNGTIDAVEIDEKLAARARKALSQWPNVSVTSGDGSNAPRDRYDIIVVSAGLTHPLESWLDALSPSGRLMFPLTMDGPQPRTGIGAMLLLSRIEKKDALAARFVMPVGFIHFRGGRDPEASEKLQDAFRKRSRDIIKVHSLRRDEHAETDTCWLHGRGFCLSYGDPQ